MEHFSEQAWADEVRGLGIAQGMPVHLAAGCLECASTGAFWRRLQGVAAADHQYAPPQDLVRLVKLQFAANAAAANGVGEKWSLANLLFDTAAQPLAAGLRGSAATARQMIYEAEGLTVDLRLDRIVPSRKVSIVGQILDNHIPAESLFGAPVVLWTDEGLLVATAEANNYGEFQLEFEPQERLRLTARLGRRRVQIPLVHLK